MKGKKILDFLKIKNSLQIFDYLSDWIRIIDTDGNILYENDSMIEFCGESTVGKNCYEENCLDKGIPRGTKVEEFDFKHKVNKELEIDGDVFLVKSSPIMDDKNNIKAIIEDFRNITVEVIAIKRYEEVAKKTQKELTDARIIQEGMLPSKGNHNGLCIDYKYIPSKFLSGDMFDVIKIDDDRVALYIADVVGHGVSASLITMFIRQTMRMLVTTEKLIYPDSLLSELIKRFGELNLEDDKYFTIFYGVYSKSKSELEYANAGHNAIPIKISKDGEVSLIEGTGLPISLILSMGEYTESTIKLNMGDKILFYTDGITETRDYFNELFGVERLMQVIGKNRRNLLDSIVNSVISYRWGSQEDDIAVLLVERLDDVDECEARFK